MNPNANKTHHLRPRLLQAPLLAVVMFAFGSVEAGAQAQIGGSLMQGSGGAPPPLQAPPSAGSLTPMPVVPSAPLPQPPPATLPAAPAR